MTTDTTDTAARWRRLPLRQIACLVPVVAVAVWAVLSWRIVEEGVLRLLTADRSWLGAAVVATALTWVAAAFARQGAVVERLPPFRLLATQFAASSANNLLPSAVGAGAVNLRFMVVCGLPPGRSSAALALHLLAEAIGRVTLLLALLAAFPHALRLGRLVPEGAMTSLITGGAVVTGGTVCALAFVRPLRRVARNHLRIALSEARSVHTRPARVLALWGGSLAFPALQATGLVAVGRSLDLAIPVMHVAVAYLAAGIVAAAVPTPGGVGSLDAALVVALMTVGTSAAVATAAVLAYRLITVWLPLLPGALVLGALVRRKVL
ncbi:lysylphosphatidylglycerol synthase transmembrane domain-containing protein [Streptomyces sp. KR80]|uniref:lysylphosphatidylglycerol synthase transmembrane domain-containing protein n=1 Tax=Streptomyces sp. KR80 TaxID=3457426 RepID=UPI003FD48FDC